MRFPVCAAAGLLALAACHSSPPAPVRIAGDAAALARLAGAWSGSYESPRTGRTGSIVFTLATGEDHAHGDVLMVPQGMTEPIHPWRPGGEIASRDTGSAQTLTIDFVMARGDSVVGTLDAYLDPQCGCSALTRFRGRIQGNTIMGSFVTRRRGAGTVTGSWSVRRS